MASFHCSELRSHTTNSKQPVCTMDTCQTAGHCVHLSGTEQTPAVVTTEGTTATTLTAIILQ